MRKSIIQMESSPKHANKTLQIPSLSDKICREFEKAQKFFRSETGKVIGSSSAAQF